MRKFLYKHVLFCMILALMTSGLAHADGFKQRHFRNEAGEWVYERSVEIAEYESQTPDIEGNILVGRSDIDGKSTTYWVEIHHEYDFHRRDLTQADIDSAALRLRSLRLNGVSIMSTAQNTRIIELRVSGDEVKEVIRVEVSQEQFNQIIDSTSWDGEIITPLVPNNIDMWMTNERRTRANFRRLFSS